MKKSFIIFMALCMAASICMLGCGTKKEESASAAINVAKEMETNQQKIEYLVSQAKAFQKSKEFQGTVEIAQHILRYLDKDSQEARALLEDARNEIIKAAKSAAEDFKKNLGK